MRSSTESFFRLGLWSNYRLAVAVLAGIALQLAIIYVPMLQRFFHTKPLEPRDLAIGIGVSMLAFIVLELWKPFRSRFVPD